MYVIFSKSWEFVLEFFGSSFEIILEFLKANVPEKETFFQGLRSLLERVRHIFFQNIPYLMVWVATSIPESRVFKYRPCAIISRGLYIFYPIF